jgi:Protein of unknown function (DUF3606)
MTVNFLRSDALRIDLAELRDARFWSHEFDCTVDELREAVEEVGVVSGEVRKYLSKRSLS